MNWIANKAECLKPEEGLVLVTTETKINGRGTYEAEYVLGKWYIGHKDVTEFVIAWMPMPTPADLDGYLQDRSSRFLGPHPWLSPKD